VKMSTQRISCEIKVPPAELLGHYANAFRILPDTGQEFLLDFLVYSKAENSASVVVRVRMQGAVLEVIREQLQGLKEVQAANKASPVIIAKGNEEVH